MTSLYYNYCNGFQYHEIYGAYLNIFDNKTDKDDRKIPDKKLLSELVKKDEELSEICSFIFLCACTFNYCEDASEFIDFVSEDVKKEGFIDSCGCGNFEVVKLLLEDGVFYRNPELIKEINFKHVDDNIICTLFEDVSLELDRFPLKHINLNYSIEENFDCTHTYTHYSRDILGIFDMFGIDTKNIVPKEVWSASTELCKLHYRIHVRSKFDHF